MQLNDEFVKRWMPMTPETKSPSVAPLKKWTIARCVLKYSLLTFLFTITLCSAIAWARSFWTTDYFLSENLFGSKKSLFLGSRQGRISVGLFQKHGLKTLMFPNDKARVIGDYGLWPDAEGSGELKERSPLAMGIIDSVQIYTHTTGNSPYYQILQVNSQEGHGVFVPHALVLIFVGSLFALIVLGRRFTLRAFFIWVTIVCILLAIAVRMRESPPPPGTITVHHGT